MQQRSRLGIGHGYQGYDRRLAVMVLFESSCQLRTFRSGLAHPAVPDRRHPLRNVRPPRRRWLPAHRQTQLVELGRQRIDQPHILIHQQHTLPGGRHLASGRARDAAAAPVVSMLPCVPHLPPGQRHLAGRRKRCISIRVRRHGDATQRAQAFEGIEQVEAAVITQLMVDHHHGERLFGASLAASAVAARVTLYPSRSK